MYVCIYTYISIFMCFMCVLCVFLLQIFNLSERSYDISRFNNQVRPLLISACVLLTLSCHESSLLVVMRCTCTCRSVLPSPLSTPPMQVLDFGWPDHLAPSLERLSSVCRSMKSWLDTDPQHVVVVHCKGGKGRTGCVIAAFMNYSEICQRYIHTCMMMMYMWVVWMCHLVCDGGGGIPFCLF